MLAEIAQRFRKHAPAVEFWSLRIIEETQEQLHMRQNVLQPVNNHTNMGAMLTVIQNGGIGYAASSDFTATGLHNLGQQAMHWATHTAASSLIKASEFPRPSLSGRFNSLVKVPWNSTSLADKIELLTRGSQTLKIHEKIVDWHARLSHRDVQSLIITSDNIEIEQHFQIINAGLMAVANDGSETQQRSGAGWDAAKQGGLEQFNVVNYPHAGEQIAEEALALLNAPECPSGEMSLLLQPSQMMLQIHESIGHPLELDRILGDERNYAGTSFVTLDMFGEYQYGSSLLNITFDPNRENELACYKFDDEGSFAEKQYIIENGILKRPLGGASSQQRANIFGVANARASDWNRPAIDRMANLNLESGDSTFDDMVSCIEKGILMDTNKSWSIDDSRNKFQFGCELGRLIENGEIKGIVKNPNYRGISASFWRNLAKVGNETTFDTMGTPYCGKGEPNQMIHVGHASPACVFHNIDVFGGE